MAELDSKRSIFHCSWLCCFPSRPKRTEYLFVKPVGNLKEEEYDYVVEKLNVKKVPVSFFEDYQRENTKNNVPCFPSRSSLDYEDTSEKCLAIYNFNSNVNVSRSSEIRNEDSIPIKKEGSSSHSTVKKVPVEYLKKCSFIKMVKSKLKNTKRDTWEVSTFSNNFEEIDYQENLQRLPNVNKSQNISIQHSDNKCLKTNKKEKKHLKMDTFGCNHYYIEQDKTALVEQRNNLQSSCLIQKTSSSKVKSDQSTQTCVEYLAILQDQIKVTASTNTETSRTAANKSALTNGALEPIKINLTLSTLKNKERNSQSKQLDNKECQTENKSSILRLNDIINENGSLADINKEYLYESRINDQFTKYTNKNKSSINVHNSENDIPEKESRYGLLETFQENSNIFSPPLNIFKREINNKTFSELNSVGTTNFFKENQYNSRMNNSHCFYSQNNRNKPSSTLNINKKCTNDDEVFQCFPERDTKSFGSTSSNMAFDFQMGLDCAQTQHKILLHSIEDLQNAREDNSTAETNGNEDKIDLSTELPESHSQFTQSITLTENNSESTKQLLPSSKNIHEIRNVNISGNSPFCSARDNKDVKNSFLRAERPNSPRLTQVQRIAELASSQNNPIKWKIVIKQRKVPEELQNTK